MLMSEGGLHCPNMSAPLFYSESAVSRGSWDDPQLNNY